MTKQTTIVVIGSWRVNSIWLKKYMQNNRGRWEGKRNWRKYLKSIPSISAKLLSNYGGHVRHISSGHRFRGRGHVPVRLRYRGLPFYGIWHGSAWPSGRHVSFYGGGIISRIRFPSYQLGFRFRLSASISHTNFPRNLQLWRYFQNVRERYRETVRFVSGTRAEHGNWFLTDILWAVLRRSIQEFSASVRRVLFLATYT